MAERRGEKRKEAVARVQEDQVLSCDACVTHQDVQSGEYRLAELVVVFLNWP